MSTFQLNIPKHLRPDNQPIISTTEAKVVQKKSPAKPKPIAETAADSFTEEKENLAESVNHQLFYPAKRPTIVWKQTPEMIIIAIAAPDVNNYYLKVGPRHVHFR